MHISEASTVLGISTSATLDEAKSAYKKQALKVHPDKNTDDTTAAFQQVSAAMEAFQKLHSPRPTMPSMDDEQFHHHFTCAGGGGFFFSRDPYPTYPSGTEPFARGGRGRRGQDDWNWGKYDQEYDDDEEEESGDEEDFFEFMYSDLFNGAGGTRREYSHFRQPPPFHSAKPESAEDRESRLARERIALKEAHLKRERDEKLAKAKKERERLEEMEAGQARREAKIANKKAAFVKAKETAAAKSQALLGAAQKIRSATFAAARAGASREVKKFIWEDNVAALDGEFLPAWVERQKEKEEEKVKEREKRDEELGTGNVKDAAEKPAPGKENVKTPIHGHGIPATSEQSSETGKSKKRKSKKGKGGAPAASIPVSTPPPTSINSSRQTNSPSPHQKSVSTPPDSNAPPSSPSASINLPTAHTDVRPPPTTPTPLQHDPKETLLHIAVRKGDVELAEWLVDHGASPDERDSHQFTPFHLSLRLGHPALIRYFISLSPPATPSPADASYPLPPEETLLSLAVSSANAEAVSLVLEHSTIDDVWSNWRWIDDFVAGNQRRKTRTVKDLAVWEAVKYALVEKDGFQPPAGYRKKRKGGK